MKNILVVGLSGLFMLSTLQAHAADTSLDQLEGRYAADCSRAKALQVSYIVGDHAMHRYEQGKATRAALNKTWQDPKVKQVENLSYHSSRQYGEQRIDFYQSATKPWIVLHEKSGFMGWGESTVLLPQCQV